MTEPAATAPRRPIRWYWEDFPAGNVREFGAYAVTRDAVLAFASQFDVLSMTGWGMFGRREPGS